MATLRGRKWRILDWPNWSKESSPTVQSAGLSTSCAGRLGLSDQCFMSNITTSPVNLQPFDKTLML